MEEFNKFWLWLWVSQTNPVMSVNVVRGSNPVEVEVPTTSDVLHGLPGFLLDGDALIRDEYKLAQTFIESQEGSRNAVVVIGHPGIGTIHFSLCLKNLPMLVNQGKQFSYTIFWLSDSSIENPRFSSTGRSSLSSLTEMGFHNYRRSIHYPNSPRTHVPLLTPTRLYRSPQRRFEVRHRGCFLSSHHPRGDLDGRV